jgi:type IV secretory pathway VirD2 relaxase
MTSSRAFIVALQTSTSTVSVLMNSHTTANAEVRWIGRLVAYGLDDELKESVYAVVDGVDGRVHHLRLPD